MSHDWYDPFVKQMAWGVASAMIPLEALLKANIPFEQ
jgi:hypothetical protein